MEIWSVQDIKPHITDIWRSLNKLILPPSENEVAELAVQTLVAIITKFIESNSANRELDQLLDDISASKNNILVYFFFLIAQLAYMILVLQREAVG